MTLLARLAEVSEKVGATPARRAKVRELAPLLRSFEPTEINVGVHYLAGEPRQGRFGIGAAVLGQASVVSHKQLELFFRFFSGTWPSTSGLNGLQSLATALEFSHDGLDGGFPNKRLGIFVPGICKFLDGGDEIGDT